ncbi:MOSC domain-containing protein [Alterinioella nitratireducens]|uniref:MOSC domain-containing protein n=1 Tax=Alterinioella nitratireducens TaxID=2735915 RepID=UPI00405A4578
MNAVIEHLARDEGHNFSKTLVEEIELVKGLGIKGDAHAGETVKHRSRVKADPTQPNLRQVHLIHCELFEELAEQGFSLGPADLGENITTRGIDLLGLPRGTRLHLGQAAVVEVTGLRNPCHQVEAFMPGLLRAVLVRGPNKTLIRKTGIMGIVLEGGMVGCGDPIVIEEPEMPHLPLERV